MNGNCQVVGLTVPEADLCTSCKGTGVDPYEDLCSHCEHCWDEVLGWNTGIEPGSPSQKMLHLERE